MSWTKLATATGSTKRATVVAGRRGDPVENLTGLQLTPLYPADPGRAGELLQRIRLDTPHQLLECFVVGQPDIRTGDTLSVAGVDYPIRGVARFDPPAGSMIAYTHLMVESLI